MRNKFVAMARNGQTKVFTTYVRACAWLSTMQLGGLDFVMTQGHRTQTHKIRCVRHRLKGNQCPPKLCSTDSVPAKRSSMTDMPELSKR